MTRHGYDLSVQHEVVSECCVLGLPDKDYGEVVCAIIVPQADAKRRSEQELKPAMSLEELQNWSKEKLAPYKVILQNISHINLDISLILHFCLVLCSQ